MKRLALLLVAAVACSADDPEPLGLAGDPANLNAAPGSPTTITAGANQEVPLAVVVTDADGVPVAAVEVVFQASAGALSDPVDTTDASGTAQVAWQMPSTGGIAEATAEVAGLTPVSFTATVSPVASGTVVFRYIDAGSYHTCGITTTEQLLCWGYGGDGQLGGATTSTKVLVPSLILGDVRYRLVSGGRYHGCALTLAGNAQCWGNNSEGRLGDGQAPTPSSVPSPVIAPNNTFPTFQAISAGRLHSCAVDLGQQAWCWGSNAQGELGFGTVGPPDAAAIFATPLVASANVKAIVTGGLHTCAVGTNGAAACWGYNVAGQLGTSDVTTTGTPTAVVGGLTFRTDPAVIFHSPSPDFPLPPGPFIAAGQDHTCGIATDNETYCWGLNENGQLGDASRTNRTIPTSVSGADVFVAVTAGLSHTCALNGSGAAFCWGDNSHGQLGDGTQDDRTTPTPVAGGLLFAYIKAGDISTCGLTSTGVAYCWGDNEYGQLGDGTTTASAAPVKVAFQP